MDEQEDMGGVDASGVDSALDMLGEAEQAVDDIEAKMEME